MYEVSKLGRKHNLSIPGQLNLFDKMVKYGVMEIVKSLMIYGELCRYHLEIDIEIRMISYWAKFVDMVNNQNFPMLFIIYFSPCLTHIARTLHDLYFCQTHYTNT
jgi:hypothetical protein